MWQSKTLTLPEERTEAAAAVAPDGILLVGGRNKTGVVDTTLKTKLDATAHLGAWTAEAKLVAPQADATAIVVGDYIWLYGGTDGNTAVGAVQRGSFGKAAAAGLPVNPDLGKVVVWAAADSQNLPAARTDAAGWSNSGSIYLAGGTDGTAPKDQVYWATPTADGTITQWLHLDAGDLPAAGLQGGAAVVNGPNVIIIGGESDTGVLASSVRANSAPQAPYFQLGLVGMVIPGLTIQGEIGQQLGYLNASLVGGLNFTILILIGVAFAHKAQTKAFLGHVLARLRRTTGT